MEYWNIGICDQLPVTINFRIFDQFKLKVGQQNYAISFKCIQSHESYKMYKQDGEMGNKNCGKKMKMEVFLLDFIQTGIFRGESLSRTRPVSHSVTDSLTH